MEINSLLPDEAVTIFYYVPSITQQRKLTNGPFHPLIDLAPVPPEATLQIPIKSNFIHQIVQACGIFITPSYVNFPTDPKNSEASKQVEDFCIRHSLVLERIIEPLCQFSVNYNTLKSVDQEVTLDSEAEYLRIHSITDNSALEEDEVIRTTLVLCYSINLMVFKIHAQWYNFMKSILVHKDNVRAYAESNYLFSDQCNYYIYSIPLPEPWSIPVTDYDERLSFEKHYRTYPKSYKPPKENGFFRIRSTPIVNVPPTTLMKSETLSNNAGLLRRIPNSQNDD